MGGWGVAPLARSTPTRSAARDTPKKIKLLDLVHKYLLLTLHKYPLE
ncbi:MAG: hypothetical protein RML94_16045 [Bacteroidia bacterium]|nr:hypothetical protein [Bacteroidia bacterium]